jgi:5'-methylthioadenosine phosphorylase
MTDQIRIGIIGGSGLYKMEAIIDRQELAVSTPFGKPSDHVITGTLSGQRVAFIARHGRGHILTPTEVPYRANIYALKSLGVQYIIAVSACGSLRIDYAPGHFVVPNQLVDFTKGKRAASFFGDGLVAHVGAANPFCDDLRSLLADSIESVGGAVHRQGTFITIEGPRFSTKAESALYRQWGMDIIGMTTSPEAFLAREAEIAYAVMAMVTDYDVWHEQEVNVAAVFATFDQNLRVAQDTIVHVVPKIAALSRPVTAHVALKYALTTAPERISDERRETMKLFMQNLLDQS